VGRFLSVDPLVGNPLSAQDYNGYSYCGNNPLAFTDPSGYQKYAVPMPYCYPGNEFYLTRLFGSIPGGGFGGGGGGDDPSGYYPSALDDSPRSMFDWWTPYQNSKKQGNTATPMQYLNDVNRGKNYWTEEYSRDQDMADYKKDLAVFPNSLRGEMRIVIKHYYQAQVDENGRLSLPEIGFRFNDAADKVVTLTTGSITGAEKLAGVATKDLAKLTTLRLIGRVTGVTSAYSNAMKFYNDPGGNWFNGVEAVGQIGFMLLGGETAELIYNLSTTTIDLTIDAINAHNRNNQ